MCAYMCMSRCMYRNLYVILPNFAMFCSYCTISYRMLYTLYYMFIHYTYYPHYTVTYTIDLRALSLYHEAAISAALPSDLSLTCVDPGRLAVEAPLGLGTGLGQAETGGTRAQVEMPFTDLRTLPEDMYEMLDTLGTCMRCG